MKRKTGAKPKDKSNGGFTSSQVGTLLERLESKFNIFGERQEGIIEKIDATHEQVGRNAQDIAVLKVAVKGIKEDVAVLKEDVAVLKETVKSMAAKIEALTESIDKLIKTKAEQQDFQALEKRVAALEAKAS
jgi:archaellum component FlaC